MNKFRYLAALLFFCGIMLNSCEMMNQFNLTESDLQTTSSTEINSSLSSSSDYLSQQLEAYRSVVLNDYIVEFTGQVFNESNGGINSTTFHYKVSGTSKTPQLDSFFLETPICAGTPVSWTPNQSSKLLAGGIIWNKSITKDDSEIFSITYSGEVSLGVIDAVVTRGSDEAKGLVIGPCSGVVSIAGSIFIDANENATKQSSESGIGNVVISLLDNNKQQQVIANEFTTSSGFYTFKVLKGNYTVIVSDVLLNSSYRASTPVSVDLGSTTTNVSGINFGYIIDSEKVIRELNDGTILKNTEPTKYWIDQLNRAGKRSGDYTVAQIDGFLNSIENLLLPVPFKFGTDKKKEALAILKNPIKTDLDAFLQQLLTAELNVVSNRGALTVVNGQTVLNEGFNNALLILSEAIACEAVGACSAVNDRKTFSSSRIATDLSGGTEVLSAFNGTGGIR